MCYHQIAPLTDHRFQGWRPAIFGDVWDRMTALQRRRAFWSDIVVAFCGAGLIYALM